MIRKASLGDVPALYTLGRRIHQASDDRGVKLDEVKVRTHLAGLITSPKGIVLIDENESFVITGVLVGFCDELWWSKERYAVPLVMYAERPGALLWMFNRFRKWAFEQKCAVQIPLDCSFGGKLGKKTVELFRRKRFEEIGASFIVRREA